MASREALKFFKSHLNDYEVDELLTFSTVYYIRTEAKDP